MPDVTNINPLDANPEKHENGERFESDTQKIVRRHLENKDDIITDEDIASVRVGMVPPLDEATEARFEDEDAIEEVEKDTLGDEDNIAEGKNGKDNRLTPWDTIDPAAPSVGS